MLNRSNKVSPLNILSIQDRSRVAACLADGKSLRTTVRMTGVHRATIQKLLVELGGTCSSCQDKMFRNLRLNRIQCDEIWAFCGANEKNASLEQKSRGWGDTWTWTAPDAQFTLLTNAFSKKVENHDAVALHFIHYNFCRIHSTLRVTPAMVAGIADHVLSLDEVISLTE